MSQQFLPEDAARSVMEEHYLGSLEVKEAWYYNHWAKESSQMPPIPFGAEQLYACQHDFILVADSGMSIVDMSQRPCNWQHIGSNEYFQYFPQASLRCREEPAWRLILRTPVADTIFKSWTEQLAQLSKDDVVPNMRQMIYAILLNYAAREERLFSRTNVRVSDRETCDKWRGQWQMGSFDERLFVGVSLGDGREFDTGLAASRLPSEMRRVI